MWETWVQSLGQEDPLEKEMATHSSILAWGATVHGVAKSRTRLSNLTFPDLSYSAPVTLFTWYQNFLFYLSHPLPHAFL